MFSSNATQVASTAANYIEDVFSTWLYTGSTGGGTQNIVNNIDLATKGGLTWIKCRNVGYTHFLNDTARGAGNVLQSNTTSANQATTSTFGLTSFNADGFTVKDDGLGPGGALAGQGGGLNFTGNTYASWTFRKAEKFFDVVTYTGTGANRTIAHNLGSVPGCMIIKQTNTGGADWAVYHRSQGATKYGLLNTTAAFVNDAGSARWNNTDPTSTVFSVGNDTEVNLNGSTYVAYLFAHDAGGFGLTGTDNVISCGSVTLNGSGAGSVTLGYEPQWILLKNSQATENWQITDNMRGMPVGSADALLLPNSSAAESSYDDIDPTSTGFNVKDLNSSQTYIYIAIRRGPMKVPTDATKVFSVTSGNFSTPYTVTTGFPVDLCYSSRTGGSARHFNDRLRGPTVQTSYRYLATNTTDAELTGTSAGIGFQSNTSIIDNDWVTGANAVWWNFGRAPGFFDEVCYTGTGVTLNVNHNLAAVPELMIVKGRNSASAWDVYSQPTGNTNVLRLSTTNATSVQPQWNNTTPTSTVFTVKGGETANVSGRTYVAYLFATCPGVSKVGSYTGNGSTQTIDCGFTGGARFVLIKRTDSTGDWYVYDTARGMTALTDPYLLANTSAAQTATLGSVTTVSTGFALNSAVLADINVNGGSYIYFSVA
jgi:hypothetical protein